MTTGFEVAAANYLFTWAKRRGALAADQAGKEVDTVLQTALGTLRRLVVERLGADNRQLTRLEQQGTSGDEAPSAKAVNAVAGALEAEMEEAPDFAERLAAAVAAVEAAGLKDVPVQAVTGDGGFSAGTATFTARDQGIVVGVNHGGIQLPPVPGANSPA